MKKSPVLRASLLLALLTSGVPMLAGAATLENIRAAQEIVLAHRDASVPFSYLDDNARPVGYAMDICLKLADAVRRELNLPSLPVRYLPVTSANRIPAIAQGKASLECGSTTNNAERRKQVAFTIPHFISAVRVLVRSDSGFKNIDDLAGRTVTVTGGTTSVPTVRRINGNTISS